MSGVIDGGGTKSGSMDNGYYIKAWAVVDNNESMPFQRGFKTFLDQGTGKFRVTLSHMCPDAKYHASAENMHTLNNTPYETKLHAYQDSNNAFVDVYTFHSNGPQNRFDATHTTLIIAGN